MSGLIGSILSTTNALKANQTAIQTSGKNMANVNNPNYTRQRLEFGIAGGISQASVTQLRDTIIEAKLIRESSLTGSLAAQNRVNSQIQIIFGEQISGDVMTPDTLGGSTAAGNLSGGVSTAIGDFFNALNAWTQNPGDIPTKATVIAQAEVMVSRFNTLSSDLERLDEDVVRNIEGDLKAANNLLDDISRLNREIARVEIQKPGTAFEFRDIRQQKLEELARYIDFESREVDNGEVLITVQDKTPAGGRDIVLVDRGQVMNRLRFNEESNEIFLSAYTTQPLGPSPNATAYNIKGGTLHGYLHTRSTTDPHGDSGSFAVGTLATMREDLDTLAREIASRVSAIYDDPGLDPPRIFFDTDGLPGAPDPADFTAGNIRLYGGDPQGNFGPSIPPLNAVTLVATATGNAGANELALNMADLAKVTSSNLRGNTFTQFVSDMATNLGFDISNTKGLLESQELVIAQLKEDRASVSGVSIDEELANIIRFQRSFEASARVLRVMDELLSLVANGLVR